MSVQMGGSLVQCVYACNAVQFSRSLPPMCRPSHSLRARKPSKTSKLPTFCERVRCALVHLHRQGSGRLCIIRGVARWKQVPGASRICFSMKRTIRTDPSPTFFVGWCRAAVTTKLWSALCPHSVDRGVRSCEGRLIERAKGRFGRGSRGKRKKTVTKRERERETLLLQLCYVKQCKSVWSPMPLRKRVCVDIVVCFHVIISRLTR